MGIGSLSIGLTYRDGFLKRPSFDVTLGGNLFAESLMDSSDFFMIKMSIGFSIVLSKGFSRASLGLLLSDIPVFMRDDLWIYNFFFWSYSAKSLLGDFYR